MWTVYVLIFWQGLNIVMWADTGDGGRCLETSGEPDDNSPPLPTRAWPQSPPWNIGSSEMWDQGGKIYDSKCVAWVRAQTAPSHDQNRSPKFSPMIRRRRRGLYLECETCAFHHSEGGEAQKVRLSGGEVADTNLLAVAVLFLLGAAWYLVVDAWYLLVGLSVE